MSVEPDQAVSREGTNAERRSSEIRRRIVDTATALFSELGYADTTMERVAVEAGVARATVFNHFSQKELLLDAALTGSQLSYAHILLADADPATHPRVRISRALDEWAGSFAGNVGTAVPLIRAWVYAGGPYLPGTGIAAVHLYSGVIERAQDAGTIPLTGSPLSVGRALNDCMIGAMVRWTDEPAPTAESLRTALQAALRAITFE